MSIPDTLPFFTPKYIQIPSSTNNHHPFLNRFPQQNQKQWVFFKNHPSKQIPPKTKNANHSNGTAILNLHLGYFYLVKFVGKIHAPFRPIGSTSMDRQGVLYCHGVEARCKVMTSGMVVFKIPWDKSWDINYTNLHWVARISGCHQLRMIIIGKLCVIFVLLFGMIKVLFLKLRR